MELEDWEQREQSRDDPDVSVQRRTLRAGFRPAVWAARWGLGAGQLRALAIMVGGATGALARGGLAEAFPAAAGEWPY